MIKKTATAIAALILAVLSTATSHANTTRPERHPSVSWCDSTKGQKDSVCWDWDEANGFYLVLGHKDVYVPSTGDYIEGAFTR